MIITLTLNPIVDYTASLPVLEPGGLHRLDGFRRDPAGKGLNVAWVLRLFGVQAKALCLLGGDEGDFIRGAMQKRGLPLLEIRISGSTRMGVKICEESTGRLTELNERGPRVNADELDELSALLCRTMRAGDTIVLSGSLPPGAPVDSYARLIGLARAAGSLTVLDADGEALRLGLAAGPDIIKPNGYEAGRLLGRPVGNTDEAVEAARELAASGPTVLLTLGASGVVVATTEGVFKARPPAVAVMSTVGCGDTFLAGALTAREWSYGWRDTVRFATAAGAAAAELEGTSFPSLERVMALLPEVEAEEV